MKLRNEKKIVTTEQKEHSSTNVDQEGMMHYIFMMLSVS